MSTGLRTSPRADAAIASFTSSRVKNCTSRSNGKRPCAWQLHERREQLLALALAAEDAAHGASPQRGEVVERVLRAGAPAGAEYTLDHLATLWGRTVRGILGGEGQSEQLLPTLVELHAQGRFPFDRLVQFFTLDEVNDAMAASARGEVLKPVLKMA